MIEMNKCRIIKLEKFTTSIFMCRICLESKRNMNSIFETDQGLSYASMIALITGIKIVKDENELICIPCRRKLRDFYEFKLLIERSDLELCKQSKVFKFNTIDDIKREFDSQLNDAGPGSVVSDCNLLFQDEYDYIYYNDTLITKLIKQERKTVSIEGYRNKIKSEKFEDYDHVDDYVQDSSMDEEYSYKKKKNTIRDKTSNKTTKPIKVRNKNVVNKICIRPTILNNIKMVKPFQKRAKRRKSNCTPKRKDTLCPFCGKICKNNSLTSHILIHTGYH